MEKNSDGEREKRKRSRKVKKEPVGGKTRGNFS